MASFEATLNSCSAARLHCIIFSPLSIKIASAEVSNKRLYLVSACNKFCCVRLSSSTVVASVSRSTFNSSNARSSCRLMLFNNFPSWPSSSLPVMSVWMLSWPAASKLICVIKRLKGLVKLPTKWLVNISVIKIMLSTLIQRSRSSDKSLRTTYFSRR